MWVTLFLPTSNHFFLSVSAASPQLLHQGGAPQPFEATATHETDSHVLMRPQLARTRSTSFPKPYSPAKLAFGGLDGAAPSAVGGENCAAQHPHAPLFLRGLFRPTLKT